MAQQKALLRLSREKYAETEWGWPAGLLIVLGCDILNNRTRIISVIKASIGRRVEVWWW